MTYVLTVCCQATRELQDENYKLTNQFKIMQKRCVAYEQAQSAALEGKILQ